jgi:hypothetical protein
VDTSGIDRVAQKLHLRFAKKYFSRIRNSPNCLNHSKNQLIITAMRPLIRGSNQDVF